MTLVASRLFPCRLGAAALGLAVLGAGMVAPSSASAQDEEGSADVETPGQALEKAAPPPPPPPLTPGQPAFEGSVLMVERPSDDLYEALPTGSDNEFRQRGYEVVRPDRVEVIVDRDGKIYEDRKYQGIIPGIRNAFDDRRQQRRASKHYVTWVGFQPMAAVSRVFWQLTHAGPRFEVNKVDATTLEVVFPGARMPRLNAFRALETQFYGGPVASIDGKRVRGGVKFLIKLKEPANYLYRFEAPFLYVDFERSN